MRSFVCGGSTQRTKTLSSSRSREVVCTICPSATKRTGNAMLLRIARVCQKNGSQLNFAAGERDGLGDLWCERVHRAADRGARRVARPPAHARGAQRRQGAAARGPAVV